MPRGRYDAQCYGKVISASVFSHVGRSQIDHYLLSGNPESHRLESRHSPEQTLLHRNVSQTDKMNPDAGSDIHFHCDRHCLDANAFGAINIDYHNSKIFANCRAQISRGTRVVSFKKRKNVV